MKNISNILTLVRLFSSVIFSIILSLLLPFDINWLNYCLAFIFTLICLTDFFDGFFARRFKTESFVGGALDHIADKFLIISCFLVLSHLHKILFVSALILILREIFVMSLRNLALIKGFDVKVSVWGKLKVAANCFLVIVAIINKHKDFTWENNLSVLQIILTISSIFLSVYSAYLYFLEFKHKLDQKHIDI